MAQRGDVTSWALCSLHRSQEGGDDRHGFFAAGRDSHCSIHRNTVVKLAHTYRSPLLFCDLEVRTCSRRPQGWHSQITEGVAGCFLEDHDYLSEGAPDVETRSSLESWLFQSLSLVGSL